MFPLLIALLVLLATYIYRYYQNVKRYPKGPFPLPFVGNLFMMDFCRPMDAYMEIAKEYGPVYTLFLPGPYVIINDYENLKNAFVVKGDDFVGRVCGFPENLFNTTSYGGVLTSDGEAWRENKRISVHILRDFGVGKNAGDSMIQDCVTDFVEHVKTIENADGVDMLVPIQVCMTNVINQLLFGDRYSYTDCQTLLDFTERGKVVLQELLKSRTLFLIREWPWIRHIPILGYYAHDQWFDKLKPQIKMIRDKMDACLEKYSEDGDPTCYVHAYKQKLGDKMEHGRLLDLCTDFFLAGVEITTYTLGFATLYLAKHQHVQKRVRDEILSSVGASRIVSASDKPNLVYTQATILEILRLASIVPINTIHRTVRDTSIGDLKVPENTYVFGQTHSVMHSSPVFPNPKQFDPSRFLNADGRTINKEISEQMCAFSLGKRQCTGEGLARMELFIFLVTLLQKFEILPPNDGLVDTEPIFGALFLPKPHLLRIKSISM